MKYRVTVEEITEDQPAESGHLVYQRELDHLDMHAVIIAVDGLDKVPAETQG